jgi:hypothetical protein
VDPSSFGRSFGSPSLPDEDLARFQKRASYAKRMVADREGYLAKSGVDGDVFGTYWGGHKWLDTIADKIGAGEREILERLRLIYVFTGFPIAEYRRSETFPVVDPVFERYLKLREITPSRYRFAAPAIAGEAGWKLDGGLVNVDVAIVQERIQHLYFGGVLDWLEGGTARRLLNKLPGAQRHAPRSSLIEIGAGCGLFALGLLRVVRPARYYICDVPETLAISFAYLNLTLPNQNHYVVLPNGTYLVNSGEVIPFDSIREGIIYIPNYMMHRYGENITVDMAINAMSLHEMHPAQIAYYGEFIRSAIAKRKGVFIDINAHYGHVNAINDPVLSKNLAHVHRLDFIDLALCARIWTNSLRTLDKIVRRKRFFTEHFDLEKAFRIDQPNEDPPFSIPHVLSIMNEDLGHHVNVDFDAWLMSTCGSHLFANHLAGYRVRFPEAEVTAV